MKKKILGRHSTKRERNKEQFAHETKNDGEFSNCLKDGNKQLFSTLLLAFMLLMISDVSRNNRRAMSPAL